MKHVFLFDPKAFSSQQWKMDAILDSIGQFFRTQGKQDVSIQLSRFRRNALGILQEEAEKAKPGEPIRVYAIGGEEILYDCINSVTLFPNIQLAIVPYGETNDFLKIFEEENVESFRDIPSLVQAEMLPTDVIRWGINYALNSCYIGMSSAVSKKIKDLKSSLGKNAFIEFGLKILYFLNKVVIAFDNQISKRQYKITVDGEDYSGSYSLIHIANGPYHRGKLTGLSDATPDDGLLDVALIKSSNPFKTLWAVYRYNRGKKPKNCSVVQGRRITIFSDNQMWIQLDNEYIQDTDISLNVIHHAIQVAAVKGLYYPLASISAL